eukprot:gene7648-694_t
MRKGEPNNKTLRCLGGGNCGVVRAVKSGGMPPAVR